MTKKSEPVNPFKLLPNSHAILVQRGKHTVSPLYQYGSLVFVRIGNGATAGYATLSVHGKRTSVETVKFLHIHTDRALVANPLGRIALKSKSSRSKLFKRIQEDWLMDPIDS